jgi:hypothetical protein
MVKAVSSGVKQKLLKELKNRIDGGDELAMDYGSRMQRAKEQGFDTDTTYYHGTKDDFGAFDPDRAIGTQFWSTTDKAAIESGDVGAQGKGVIKEMYSNVKNPAGWDEYDKIGIDELRARGFDGVKLNEGDQSTLIAFDPSQYRDVNAAFDPAKKDSSNLLASVGAGVTGTAALTASDDSDASFIGMGAKTWNKGAEQLAKKMEAQGSDRHDIWQATGDMGAPTFRDVDGYLKQEISDKSSSLTDYGRKQSFAGDMGEAYQNPELFEAYPDLKNINTTGGYDLKGAEGYYSGKSPEQIALGTEDKRSIASHELTHAIQQREGFARGGSPEMFNANQDKQYRSLAGEAEARNVQERLDFDMQKRKAIPPWQTRDIAQRDLIVRGNKPAAAAAGALTGSWALSSYGQDRANDAVKYGVPQVMETEETPNAEALANMIEKWSQTPIGSPLEGTSNYLRNLGRKQSTGTKVTNALGLAFDFL